MMLTAMMMPATDFVATELFKFLHGDEIKVLCDRSGLCTINFHPCLLKPGKRTRTDTTDDNGINMLSAKSFEWSAGAVAMVDVPVNSADNRAILRIDNQKHWR